MPGAELAYEAFALALETTRGTAVTPPTDYMNLSGMITPKSSYYRPPDMMGTLAEFQRSEPTRQWGEWGGDGALDPNKLPIFANMAVKGGVTTPVDQSQKVVSVTVTAPGSGYTVAPAVVFTGGAGTGAAATALISGGAVVGVIVTAQGTGYTSNPTMSFTGGGGGSGAAATSLVGGTAMTSKLWQFLRGMTSDNLKSATTYWGDPNLKMLQSAYCMADELDIDADSTGGGNGATMTLSGTGKFPAQVTAPALPAVATGPLIVPGRMQVWIDTVAPFGTTPVTGRVAKASHKIPTGVTYKYPASGPGGSVTFDHVGRKPVHPEANVTMELIDLTQYTLWEQASLVKMRVRYNGPLIETSNTVAYYNYVQVDVQGKFDGFKWSDVEKSNRSMEVQILGEYSTELGSDLLLQVQNSKSTL